MPCGDMRPEPDLYAPRTGPFPDRNPATIKLTHYPGFEPGHEVSLAVDIGRPRLSVTCQGCDVALADVCFEAHYGLKSDIAPCPKTCTKPDSCTAASSPLSHCQIAGNLRRSPFLCILGRVRLPMKRMEA
jgi:hypothetical protein